MLLTGEAQGYYADYATQPAQLLGRALAQGFAYQGETSASAAARAGEPSAHLPPTAFVDFLQNHDQIGNRAQGERLPARATGEALRAVSTLLLLAPGAAAHLHGRGVGRERAVPVVLRLRTAAGARR